jgi:hypothetical protein
VCGYSIPFLFPQVSDWNWEDTAELRRDRNMARFRAVLREIEQEAAAEAGDGDLEAAARYAYERHSAAAVPDLTGYAVLAHGHGRVHHQRRVRTHDVRPAGPARRSCQRGDRICTGGLHGDP